MGDAGVLMADPAGPGCEPVIDLLKIDVDSSVVRAKCRPNLRKPWVIGTEKGN
jgi:hypothetical protein